MSCYIYKTSSEIASQYNINIRCNVEVTVGLNVDEAKVKKIIEVGQKYFKTCAQETDLEKVFIAVHDVLPAEASIQQKESKEYKELALINADRKIIFKEMSSLNIEGYFLYKV